MYIYHALINALSAHMIHINLNMIFYTHGEHSPTKTTLTTWELKLIQLSWLTGHKNQVTCLHTCCIQDPPDTVSWAVPSPWALVGDSSFRLGRESGDWPWNTQQARCRVGSALVYVMINLTTQETWQWLISILGYKHRSSNKKTSMQYTQQLTSILGYIHTCPWTKKLQCKTHCPFFY